MSQLTKLIEFLDRDDVTEVVVATGRPVTLRMGGEYRALGRAPATSAQIELLFQGSPVADLIANGGGAIARVRLVQRDAAVDVQVIGDQIMVRLTRARATADSPASRVTRSSDAIVVSSPPLPRTRSRDHLMGPALAAQAQAHVAPPSVRAAEVAASLPRAPEPPPRAPEPLAASSADGFEGMLSRSSDGGPGAVPVAARDASGRMVQQAPVGVRKRPITMPPGALASAALEPTSVERSVVPTDARGGPAKSPFSVDLPPGDPSAELQVVPTSNAPPAPRATPRAMRAVASPAPAPAAPVEVHAAPTVPAAVPVAPAGAAPYTPARRHTITAAPTFEPLPPLAAGKARATPELLAILAGARGRNASDLHLIGDRGAMERTVRGLEQVGRVLTGAEVERMLGALLSPAQQAQLDARGYADAALDVEGAGRVRANISRFRGGVKGSFRLVMAAPPTLDQLGLPRELAKVTTYHQGLVVIAGPNGHGKTTTLAALVDLINTHKAHHILTIEDPVEVVHPRKRALISQREVGNHTRSFAAALKASLREDPDVIVIGELRDRETVEIALSAAETGHLVMATMSTPSAAKSLDRLIDMFPPDDQQQVRISLAAALKFVVAQRLLPAADGAGVVAAVELLTGVLPLAALIRDNKLFQVASLQQRGRAFGMIRLDDSLAELVRAGRITEDVAVRAADSKKDLAAALRAPTSSPAIAVPARPAPDGKGRLGGLFNRRSE